MTVTLEQYLAPKKLGYIIFYRGDSGPAIELAKELRDKKEMAMLRDAAVFDDAPEHCKAVILMPSLFAKDWDRIVAIYGDKVEKQPNQETIEAIQEADSGGGEVFHAQSGQEIVDQILAEPRRRGRPRKTPLETAI